MTQEDFVHTNRTTVGRLENNERDATLGKVEELAHELDVHPFVLLTMAYCTELTKAQTAEFMAAALRQIDELFASADDMVVTPHQPSA